MYECMMLYAYYVYCSDEKHLKKILCWTLDVISLFSDGFRGLVPIEICPEVKNLR